jgi:hypothetical protein
MGEIKDRFKAKADTKRAWNKENRRGSAIAGLSGNERYYWFGF